MASIESSIYLVDQVSPTLFGIADAVQNVTTAMDIASNTMDHAFSPHSIEEVGESMVELQQKLQNINHMQEAINTVANNVYVLPKDTGEELEAVNYEIRRINTALEFIQNNPFDLDSSFAILQIESLTSSMETAIQRQSELNQQLGDMPERMISLQVEPNIPEPLITPQEPVTVPIEPEPVSDPLIDPQEPVTVPIEPNIPEPLIDPPEPVKIPVQWETDNLEVFTGAGIERFQQEIQSANDMLHRLNETQNHISNTAMQMDIFPENAITDISNMQSRIQEIQGHIQMLESNPLNLGVDAVNIELEQLRARLSQAIQEQQQLNRAVQSMDVRSANEAYLRLSRTVGHTERYIRDNTEAQQKFNREIQEGASCVDHLANRIMGMVAAYGGLQGIRSLVNLSDEYTQTQARLNMLVSDEKELQQLQDQIFASAQRSRGEYLATADVVAKLALRAKDVWDNNQQAVLFTENLNKMFVIAGASTEEMKSASLQLTQALGSGVLRGEELNAVLEAAPNVIQTIAAYMNVPSGKIKSLAEEGLITADIVKNALLSATDEINTTFESMPMTWSQVWINITNKIIYATQPVLQGINSLANHWSILEPIVLGVVSVIGAYITALIVYKTITGVIAVAEAIHTSMLRMQAKVTFKATLEQWGFNAALMACPITWIVLGIIAVITIIYTLVATINELTDTTISATGIIMGAIMVAGAFIVNTVIGVCNGIYQAFFALGEPVIGIVEWILNVCSGGFDSFGDAMANLLGQIISWALSVAKIVTQIIDPIFGTDWSSSLSDLQNEVLGWGKNENAITISREVPVMNGIDYKDAWNFGYQLGEKIDDKVGGMFGQKAMEEQNLEQLKQVSGIDDINSSLNRIDKNTRDTARSVALSSTEIKYLLDMANRKSRDRYTTAINLHITNNNKVNSELDIDGVVNKMSKATLKKINEEWKASIVR